MLMGAPGLSGSGVHLTGVTRVFGSHPALVLATLDVDRGEIVLLAGPNGAGKTTLLKLIATVLSPTYGGGTVLGYDLHRERIAIRCRTELLGSRTRLYEDLTPLEYLRFVADLTLPRGRHAHEAALEHVGLAANRSTRIRELSQGMRQRVALARAHMRKPDLLLVDEPYAALDEGGRHLLDQLMIDARARGGCVLIATHDLDRAGALADRIVAMRAGRIAKDVATAGGGA